MAAVKLEATAATFNASVPFGSLTEGTIVLDDFKVERLEPVGLSGPFTYDSIGLALGPVDLTRTTIVLGDARKVDIDASINSPFLGLVTTVRGRVRLANVNFKSCLD